MKEEQLITLVASSVGFFPKEIADMLNKNGVLINANPSDTKQLTKGVFQGINSSEAFRRSFIDFYLKNKSKLSSNLSMDGYSNLTGGDYTNIGTTLFGGITGIISSNNALHSAQAQADAIRDGNASALAIEQEKTKQALINAQAGLNQASAKPSGNKTLYIALGIGGALVLGLVIFLVTRKKS
jgi:4-hydroxyphenylpyruvate dioxygenase-like putative hemolysin